MLKHIVIITFALMGLLMPQQAEGAATAQSVLASASAKWSAKSVKCSFKVAGSVRSSGTVFMSGKRFRIDSSRSKIWYNGRDMWVYNPSIKETTLTRPTAEEVAQSNPLAIIASGNKAYTAKFASKQTAGTYTLLLTPKGHDPYGLKRASLTLDKRTLAPRRLVAAFSDGSRITLDVSTFGAYGAKTSDFIYPAAKFKDVEVLDLR